MTPFIRGGMQRFSLRAQTIILMMAIGIVLSTCISFYVYQRDLGRISERVEQLSRSQTDLIKHLSIDAILSEDRPALQTIVDGLKKLDLGIDQMTVTNYDGEVLASWFAESQSDSEPYKTKTPIDYLGQNFGEIHLEWNRDILVAPMKKRAAGIVQIVVASIVGIGICLVAFVEFYFVRPLAHLESKVDMVLGKPSADIEPHNFCSRELTHLDRSLVAAVRAIREKSLKEEQLREERGRTKAAEAVAAARTEFLSLMSHEIRTPLGAILGFADLLDVSGISGDEREYVGHIRESGAFLLQILNDILDLSKIEANGIQLEKVSFSPLTVIDDVAMMLGDQAKSKDVELVLDTNFDGDLMVDGDPHRLKQIILNLAGNAVKFTEKGKIVVSAIAAEGTFESGNEVEIRFSVKDSGIGMPPEFVEKIFEPFSQGDASITRKFGGTGLGVSISRKLVSIMEGDLSVESKMGSGSEFFFTLRLPVSSEVPEKSSFPDPERSVFVERGAQNLRILVAEDDPANRKLVKSVLGRMGQEVNFAGDGEECLEILKSGETFDVLFLDLRMPKIGGMEVLRRIREGECGDKISEMPISMMSADILSQDEAKAAGANHFIVKPIAFDEIQQFLAEHARDIPEPEADPRWIRGFKELSAKGLEPSNGEGEKWVMVVDDNPAVRQMIEKFLLRWGYRTGIAVDGSDCLEQLAGKHYDAVISDLRMPGMDGMTLINRIREGHAGDSYREVSVALMTAEQMTAEDAHAAHADAYIPKPIPMESLKSFLKNVPEGPVSLAG
ncbi:response regulator [Verrucomicrobiales bacterium BCK34]|nr:response regulator [Verrucomicrobiales bacterium BCK34]